MALADFDWALLRPTATGAAFVIAYYAAFALGVVLMPGQIVQGYFKDSKGKTLQYKLNGFRVGVAVLLAWAALVAAGVLPGNLIYEEFRSIVIVSNVLGFAFAAVLLVKGRMKGESAHNGNAALDYVEGCELNPRFGRHFDLKMFFPKAGCVLLLLVVLSLAYEHRDRRAGMEGVSPSPFLGVSAAMAAHVACNTWFVLDYLFNERVQLYTYDVKAEHLGWKLVWGQMVFYPFVYSMHAWFTLDPSADNVKYLDANPHLAVACVALYAVAYCIFRGANNQKYLFKVDPKAAYLGIFKPKTVANGRLLCSGFWGAARHFNYFGEILAAVALTLPCGFGQPWPWLYPVYMAALLIPREISDGALCRKQYGEKVWAEYTAAVPSRIIPFIY